LPSAVIETHVVFSARMRSVKVFGGLVTTATFAAVGRGTGAGRMAASFCEGLTEGLIVAAGGSFLEVGTEGDST